MAARAAACVRSPSSACNATTASRRMDGSCFRASRTTATISARWLDVNSAASATRAASEPDSTTPDSKTGIIRRGARDMRIILGPSERHTIRLSPGTLPAQVKVLGVGAADGEAVYGTVL